MAAIAFYQATLYLPMDRTHIGQTFGTDGRMVLRRKTYSITRT